MLQVNEDLKHQFKERLNAPSADDEICAPLQRGELLSTIKKMKCKDAASPDNITPKFLKSLGPLALQELLSIFNSFYSLAHCPHIWRCPQSFHYLKLGNILVELHLSAPSVSDLVLSNFRNTFLLILFTSSRKPKIHSTDSKLALVKMRVARIRLLR